ncbi:hypothetical protein J2S43_006950 [Catenuloplanes nepalensis]|uniref:Uncharacterized protein n=1 Tax=Catenuloplanes nepalensis TaxID=587533 RepID=A0ABT9N4J6_9ACTN|nr:hypothetical protein [Catenuloplanes nepalensis]MDP9798438.1 hypothetical protein [Catenuloplanes nepalensis]
MYAWIWRKLPFGTPGKITGSLLITGVLVALLWFVIFPWAEPILPFDDVQVGDDFGTSTQAPAGDGAPAGTTAPGDGHDVPYDTATNNPEPTAS